MRLILTIFLFASCGKKSRDVIKYDVDTLLVKSMNRTDTIAKLIPKVDHVIHVREQKNAADIVAFKMLQKANVVKTIVIRDTIIIKEKTNFWGRKRISTDSIQTIDSTEYEKSN